MAEILGKRMGRYPDLALRRKPQQAETIKKEQKFHKNKVSLSPFRTKLDRQVRFLSLHVLYRLLSPPYPLVSGYRTSPMPNLSITLTCWNG